MARIVAIVGTTHVPVLPGLFEKLPDVESGVREAYESFGLLRQKLARAQPDVLITVGSDHLNQFFMNNMPSFLVGKAPYVWGPYPGELPGMKVPEYRARVDVELAQSLIRGGFRKSVDYGFSDECIMDHAFTVPLAYVRPEMDLPIVPIFTNVMAPPLPPARRFYEVGLAIRSIVDELPSDRRVGVLASGHLSADVGGPKMRSGAPDPRFDRQMMELIADGDAHGVIREATYERMLAAGNVTPGFLNFVLLLGLARSAPPSFVAAHACREYPTNPFMLWEVDEGGTG